MQQVSIQYPQRELPTPTEPTTTPRLRTVTGNRFPRKCACGCGFQIPRDPEIRCRVDAVSSAWVCYGEEAVNSTRYAS